MAKARKIGVNIALYINEGVPEPLSLLPEPRVILQQRNTLAARQKSSP
jgi:hypothetical protein